MKFKIFIVLLILLAGCTYNTYQKGSANKSIYNNAAKNTSWNLDI